MNEPIDNKSQEQILGKIKSGEVTMHSRLYLVWRGILWGLALCLLIAAGVFTISFIIFSLRASGVADLPNFGSHGLREFFAFFPWLFVPAVLLFLWLMERFVLNYAFAYRLPVLYSALAIIILVVIGSLAVSASSLHSNLYRSARRQELPFASPLYRFGMAHPDDFYVGEVTGIKDKTYKILTGENREINIDTTAQTHFFDPGPIKQGDFIEAVGEEKNGEAKNHAPLFHLREMMKEYFSS